MNRSELEFHKEMLAVAHAVERELGTYPARNYQMLGAPGGGPEMAHRLLRGGDTSEGFELLWKAGRLELSLEALVLLPWYSSLFTNEERDVAQRRLIAHGFDVEYFLSRRGVNQPEWVIKDGQWE